MDEYKKASKFFKKGDYNLATTYYKDLLNITSKFFDETQI